MDFEDIFGHLFLGTLATLVIIGLVTLFIHVPFKAEGYRVSSTVINETRYICEKQNNAFVKNETIAICRSAEECNLICEAKRK